MCDLPRVTTLFLATLIVLVLSGCQSMTTAQRELCANPDNIDAVLGGSICFGITTNKDESVVSSPVLVVFLHGDLSRDGHAYQMVPAATDTMLRWRSDVVSVMMLRPGYSDGANKRSTGPLYGRRDFYTGHTTAAIAEAIKTLRAHHQARRVVLVGFSGGAAIAGIIIGRQPDTVDAALLAACPCDLRAWLRSRPDVNKGSSLSPLDYADKVPDETEVIAITGDHDNNTLPRFARTYIDTLKKNGVPAEFIEAIYGTHAWQSFEGSVEYWDALSNLIAGHG